MMMKKNINPKSLFGRPKTEDEKCIAVQTHYELECSCKHLDVEVCKSCKRFLQSIYGDNIPFEGEGL